MKHAAALATCLSLLPAASMAATRSYDPGAFEAVSVAAGVEVEISLGSAYSVVAETRSTDFDDLRIVLRGNKLEIDRPPRGWFMFHRPSYRVRVVTPVLHSVAASSGADVDVKGPVTGDFAVEASSGSDVKVSLVQAGTVTAHASSGSDLELEGTCTSVDLHASSGSDLDAGHLRCERATVQASSGSDVSVFANRSVQGKASSGADVDVAGSPPSVQVEESSGGDVSVKK